MKLLVFLVMFLLIGAFFLISEYKIDLKQREEREQFVKVYSSWIGKLTKNSGKLVGFFVKMDWLPDK